MVAITTCLPASDCVDVLRRLSGDLMIFGAIDKAGHCAQVVLQAGVTEPLAVYADYQDVVFKFECIGISIRPLLVLPAGLERLECIRGWDAIKCLFRFEWEREAHAGETPPGWDPVIRHRGRQAQVPESINALAISLVGIVFWSTGPDHVVAAVLNSDEDPATLAVRVGPNAMDLLIADCELLSLEEVSAWIADVQRWIDGRGGEP